MHRIHLLTIAALFFLTACLGGCAGSADIHKNLPLTMATVKPAKGYVSKIAVTVTQTPSTAMGTKMGNLFFDTLEQAIRDEDKRLLLVTPKDAEFPQFMAQLSRQTTVPINTFDLARDGRLAGYNGLVLAAVRGIRPYTKKTGILWFRKVRYFISFDLTVDLYDPLTAAKIVGAVEEASVKVSNLEYEAVQEGVTAEVEELIEEIVELGEELGELVAESLEDRFWRTSVAKIEGERVYLPAGQKAGLSPGVRLAVFEGRRTIEGLGGERFIVPGPQVATLQVSAVGPDSAEAAVLDGGTIQVGDIAVPVK